MRKENLQPIDFMKVGKLYWSEDKEKGPYMVCLEAKGWGAKVIWTSGEIGWVSSNGFTEARCGRKIEER